jgi:hypothetical protein
MGTSWNRFSCVVAASCLLFPVAAFAASSKDDSVSDVRLTFLQGDIRVSQGNKNAPDLNKPWEQAVPGLAIEEGFSLAAGNGRAEIEFEGGSIVYLAENSLLLFKALQETDGGSTTHVMLVTGTATFSLAPSPDAVFVVETATDQFEIRNREGSFSRVDSYLDGFALTPEATKGQDLILGALPRIRATKGQTIFVPSVGPVDFGRGAHSAPNEDWEQWVSGRETQYRATLAKAVLASGVHSAFPGLNELYTRGEFFNCGDTATCWEPKLSQASSHAAQSQATSSQTSASKLIAQPDEVTEDSIEGTCRPVWVHQVKRRDAKGKLQTVSTTRTPADLSPQFSPGWSSFACDAPAFQFHRNHYVPVFDRRRHHHRHDPHCPPIHWVKSHGVVGFVPKHPKDVLGKPPVNLAHGIFLPPKGHDASFQHADLRVTERVTVLNEAPRTFRIDAAPSGPRVDAPQIQAHFREGGALAAGVDRNHGEASAIRYDYKSRSFVQSSGLTPGGALSKPVADAGLSPHGGFLDGGGGHSSDRGSNGTAYSGGGRASGSSSGSAHSSSNSGFSGGGGRSSGSSSGSSSSSGASSHSSGGSSSASSSSSASAVPSSGASGGRPH